MGEKKNQFKILPYLIEYRNKPFGLDKWRSWCQYRDRDQAEQYTAKLGAEYHTLGYDFRLVDKSQT